MQITVPPMHPADVSPAREGGNVSLRRGRGRLSRCFAGVVLVMFLVVARAGFALDITTTDGRVYKQCTITQVDPDALHITYSDGAALIPYEKLPAEIQKQYFNPAAVAAYRDQLGAQRREEERLQAESAALAEKKLREQAAEREREEAERRAAEQKEIDQRILAEQTKKARHAEGVAGICITALLFYFLPTIIGLRKTNAAAIFVFNLLLGWTFIGWVVALVWACTKDSAMDLLARQHLNRQAAGNPAEMLSEAQIRAAELRRVGKGSSRRLSDEEIRRLHDEDVRRLKGGGTRYLE